MTACSMRIHSAAWLSAALVAGVALATVGASDGARGAEIDAVLAPGTGKAFFFRGQEYIRYDLAADQADPGYPKPIAKHWRGLWEGDIDAAVAGEDGKAHFFRGGEHIRYDLAADRADAGYPRPIADSWPGLGSERVDAAIALGEGRILFFRGRHSVLFDLRAGRVVSGSSRTIAATWPKPFSTAIEAGFASPNGKAYAFQGGAYIRFDPATGALDDGYPRDVRYLWPGLWDPNEGTGHPGPRLPAAVARLLVESPSAAEVAARRRRAAASVASGETNLSATYPLYLASIEERLGAYGAQIIRLGSGAWRFRCATNTSGVRPLDVPRLTIESIDWREAKYHTEQRSQGDFMAAAGTPLSILAADGDRFFIDSVTANAPTGSISGGLNIKVRFERAGVTHRIGFSHLDTGVPRYVLEARDTKKALPTGTVFGFIGYTGNLWMGAPPATDRAYTGTGAGLPAAHTHIWFIDDASNHLRLTTPIREALDFSGTYTSGGG